MKCKTRGCKNDKVAQSLFHPRWAFCKECQKFIEIDDKDLKTLEEEGLLRYEAYQAAQEKRRQELAKSMEEKTPKIRRSKSKSSVSEKKKTKPKLKRETAVKKKTTKKKQTISPACKDHPTYGVVRKPRTDCKTCWKAYKKKFPERV